MADVPKHVPCPTRKVLITGGAGFIGSNWAAYLLQQTEAHVHIFDDLSRKGAQENLRWLRSLPGSGTRLKMTLGDVREADLLRCAAEDKSEIYHFAAQVAVTDSLADPRNDFEVNLQGTFNMLEAARKSGRRPFVLFTSTNKVYGGLSFQGSADKPLRPRSAFAQDGAHSELTLAATQGSGVNESQPLDFHSPYGCSKGAADQYVRDYARIYGLPTVVFRMSCIAGPHQWGNEDQGWVAHFLYSALQDQPITIYGDGRQVRDVLHVNDLVRAFELARAKCDRTAGEIYNVGGGAANAVSLLEVVQKIRRATFRGLEYRKTECRPGDQEIYVTDHAKLTTTTGWTPQLTVDDVLRDIELFWHANRELFCAKRQREAPVFSEALGAA